MSASLFKILFFLIQLYFILCNFLVRTLQYFQKIKKKDFCPQKVEITTLKSCSETLKSTFFSFLTGPFRPNRRIHVPKYGL